MRYNPDQSRRVASGGKFIVFLFGVLFLLLLAVVLCCRGCLSPPDLSRCTRIEVQYYPSTLEYFLPGTDLQNVLSPVEKKYLQSLKTFVVNDQQRIKVFACELTLGTCHGLMDGALAYGTPVHVHCYRNKRRLISFTVFGTLIVIDKGILGHLLGSPMFRYPLGSPNLEIIEPPEIRPFKLRGRCARNMEGLYISGSLFHKDVFGKDAKTYPEPNQWCDLIVRGFRNLYFIDENGIRRRSYSEEEISRTFTCPGAREEGVRGEDVHGEPDEPNSPAQPVSLLQSHYAMNPNCKPNSPPDTVLLFETRSGWNQHGGPELFTFDNHDPAGGCVLLNDGTVKFIRTEEELAQLRWK